MDEGLVNLLINLYTNGKGLSNDGETFKNWMLDIMFNDTPHNLRLKNVKGLWAEKLDAKLKQWNKECMDSA